MPGPFPGMDPWLEHPHWWQGRHSALITYLAEELSRTLPAGYAAFLEGRCYIEEPPGQIIPDLNVHEVRETATVYALSGSAIDPPFQVRPEAIEVQEFFVNIFGMGDEKRPITTIELLSPSNKRRGSSGWRSYKEKQREVVGSGTHFIEIDLLRKGERVFFIRPSRLPAAETWQYAAVLYRAGQFGSAEVWARTVRERLPVIAVPLKPEDPDVPLDLQAVFDRFYDAGVNRQVDYRKDPDPLLDAEDAEWACSLLKEKGLRP